MFVNWIKRPQVTLTITQKN